MYDIQLKVWYTEDHFNGLLTYAILMIAIIVLYSNIYTTLSSIGTA